MGRAIYVSVCPQKRVVIRKAYDCEDGDWICEERKLLTFVPADMVKDEYKRKIGYKEEKK